MISLAIIIVAAMLAISLIILEVFFIPGITIAGIAGGLLLVGEVVYGYFIFGTPVGHYILLGNLFFVALGFYLFTRANFLKKLALQTNIDSKIEDNTTDLQVGQIGTTLSRLNPIGKVDINGNYIEAKSPEGFIDENVEVVITKIHPTQIEVVVKKMNSSDENSEAADTDEPQ
ncbi:MAG: NfeD family protein [Bacteroidales bacterium]